LRREIDLPAANVDSLTLADREDEISAWLDDHDVGREWIIAPSLAAAGVDVGWLSRAETVLGPSGLEPGLSWVASAVSIPALLSDAREPIQRISDLVGAVKSYSQMDRASMQQTDVIEGLESTLTMLGQKLESDIAVVREYDTGVPQISAYPGELNQVWTNVINNALDAMDGSGTLRLATRAQDDMVIVEVGDSGPGMPPDVARRAFEAFYTTKDVGKGTGLGLDIARRIVEERHGGTIAIETRPGETVLRVGLPQRPRT
jgi:signal transduction histidine kinase